VDVRRDDEWEEGHIPASLHLHLGDLPQHINEVPPDQPVAVICRSGYRAALGASILAAAGRNVTAVSGGVPDWIEHGFPAEK
jgi:hydroxyacylglutathione hydrolase